MTDLTEPGASDAGVIVARVGEIEDGTGLKVSRDVLGTIDDVAVFNDADQYFALDNTCTHQNADLAEGWVEDGCVECPLHSARFSLAEGTVLSPPASVGVAAHTVKIIDETIVVVPNPARRVVRGA